ncbi:MAG: DUF6531 domain-containing protein, partial [Steroidobacteraceae bacterium]
MKGVPRMDLSRQGKPLRLAAGTGELTNLDGQGQLKRPVTSANLAAWNAAAGIAGKSEPKADGLIWLGEYALAGREAPLEAAKLFNRAIAAAPAKSREHGVAAVDHGLAELYQGAYAVAYGEFAHILKAGAPGTERKQVAIYYAHARACAGYHAQRTALGITEPSRVDPLCAVASMAVCLREVGLPYAKDKVSSALRHTGEGSNLQDVIGAAPRLGASAFAVGTSNPKALIALPKPLVAHVEHDHFIAVLKADASGVRYNCSDCGMWPGGFKHVTWRQWKAMEADAYAVITPRGSPLDLAVQTRLPASGSDIELAMTFGPIAELSGSPQAIAAAQRAADLIASISFGNFSPYLLPSFQCGFKTGEPRCASVPTSGPSCHHNSPVQECPMIPGGSNSSGGPSHGDPIDLATGEEEYRPEPDLDIYNPSGPSLHFGRIYDSLRTDGTYNTGNIAAGFGQGWSNPFNVCVIYTPNIAPGSLGGEMLPADDNCAAQRGPLRSNSGSQGHVYLDNGAVIHFAWPSNAPQFDGTHTTQIQAVDAGYPVAVTETYDPSSGKTQVQVTFPDRSVWYTNATVVNNFGGGLDPWAIVEMKDRDGNALSLNYTNYPIGGGSMWMLSSVSNSSTTLLTLQVNTTTGMYKEADDCYGRSVYYAYDSNGLLYQASEVVPTGTSNPPVRYQHTYDWCGNGPEGEYFQFLHTISVPSPTGSGMSTETINYDTYEGLLTGVADANGNTISFSGGTTSNETKVTYANSLSVNEYQFTVAYDAHMDETALYNAAGSQVYSAVYSDQNDPFRPSSVTDGLTHTWSFIWDQFGHILTETSPKRTVTVRNYSYGAFPLGELTNAYTGSQTSTQYTYLEPSGHIRTVAAPIPGQTGTGSRQTTTYAWSNLGNLTSVTSPGNNATASHTTTYDYTTDGSYNQAEALGEP